MNPGQLIKACRLELGLTQAEAAFRMGRSQSYWADLEADRRHVTIATLERVAAALDSQLSLDFFSVADLRQPSSIG